MLSEEYMVTSLKKLRYVTVGSTTGGAATVASGAAMMMMPRMVLLKR